MKPPKLNTGVESSDGMLAGKRAAYHVTADTFRLHAKAMYSDPWTAVFRELLTNAADQYIRIGRPDGRILVAMPTPDSPYVVVRDFATGIPDPEKVVNCYFAFNNSDKQGENNQTGQMGIGAKAVYSVADQYEVISYDGTRSATYHTYIDDEGFPCIRGPFYKDDTAEAGLCIRIPAEPYTQTNTTTRFVRPQVDPRLEKLQAVAASMAHIGSPYEATCVLLGGVAGEPPTRLATASVLRQCVGECSVAMLANTSHYTRDTTAVGLSVTTQRARATLTTPRLGAVHRAEAGSFAAAVSAAKLLVSPAALFDTLAQGSWDGHAYTTRKQRIPVMKVYVYVGNIVYNYNLGAGSSGVVSAGDAHNPYHSSGRDRPAVGDLHLFVNTTDKDVAIPPVQWVPSRESLVTTNETDDWVLAEYQELLIHAIDRLQQDAGNYGEEILTVWSTTRRHCDVGGGSYVRLLAAGVIVDLLITLLRTGYRGMATEPRLSLWSGLCGLQDTTERMAVIEKAVATIVGSGAMLGLIKRMQLSTRADVVTRQVTPSKVMVRRHGTLSLVAIEAVRDLLCTFPYAKGQPGVAAILGPKVQPLRTLRWLQEDYVNQVTVVQAGSDEDADRIAAVLQLYSQTVDDLGRSDGFNLSLRTYKTTPAEALPAKKKRAVKEEWLDPEHAKLYSAVGHTEYGSDCSALEYREVKTSHQLLQYAKDVAAGQYKAYGRPGVEPVLYVYTPTYNKSLVLPLAQGCLMWPVTSERNRRDTLNHMKNTMAYGCRAEVVMLRTPMRKHADKFDGYFLDVLYTLARTFFRRAHTVRRLASALRVLKGSGGVHQVRGEEESAYIGDIGTDLLDDPLAAKYDPIAARLPWFDDPINQVVDQKMAKVRLAYHDTFPGKTGSEISEIAHNVYRDLDMVLRGVNSIITRLESAPELHHEMTRQQEQGAALQAWADNLPGSGDHVAEWHHAVSKYYAMRYPLLGAAMLVERRLYKACDTRFGQLSTHASDYVSTMRARWDARNEEDAACLAEQEALAKQIRETDLTVESPPLPPYVQVDASVVPNVQRILMELKAAGDMPVDMTTEEYFPAGVQWRPSTASRK